MRAEAFEPSLKKDWKYDPDLDRWSKEEIPMRVIVTTDGSDPSRKAEQFVLRLARAFPLKILLVHAVDLQRLEYKSIPDFQVEMVRQGAKRTAEALIEKERRFFESNAVAVEPRLLDGPPGPAVCGFAEREGASLVVTGRRGQGDIKELLFGSVSSHIIHKCKVPVLVVKMRGPFPSGNDLNRPVRVLLAVDGSEATRRCLDWLSSCGECRHGMEVTLLHVVSPNQPGLEYLPDASRQEAIAGMHRSGAELLQETANQLRNKGFSVNTRVEGGSAGKTICRIYSEDKFELVLMGRHSRGELTELALGSVSHFVVHHCAGHVLIIP